MNNGLPHNIEAEKALIGSVFWSYSSLQKVCEEISGEVFYLDSHSKIFEVIKSLYQEKKPVDVGTVTSEIINRNLLLQIGGVEYLNSIVESVAKCIEIYGLGIDCEYEILKIEEIDK